MAWVFKSLWDFAAGDWQEGQVYCGFSLVTSFYIQLHSSSSKGPSSWQPLSLLASAGMPVAGKRMCFIPAPSRSRIATQAGLLILLVRWGLPWMQPLIPLFTLNVGLRSLPGEVLSIFRQWADLVTKNTQKIGLAEIRSLFANVFKFWNWMKTQHCLSCFLVCLNRDFNRNILHRFLQDAVWKGSFWSPFCLWAK